MRLLRQRGGRLNDRRVEPAPALKADRQIGLVRLPRGQRERLPGGARPFEASQRARLGLVDGSVYSRQQ